MTVNNELNKHFELIDAQKPNMGAAQRKTLATYLHDGWDWTDSGSDESENINKDNEFLYVRADGITRPV